MKGASHEKKICCLLSLILVCNLFGFHSYATEYVPSASNFEYPIHPGTEKWSQLNHGERVLASQIPENILNSMSTAELANVVLQYPCATDMIFYNTYQEGFMAVKNHFNGLTELLSRDDAGSELLQIYKNIDVSQTMSTSETMTSFNFSLDLLYLETILAQPEITQSLSTEETAELLQLVDQNYTTRQNNTDSKTLISMSGYYESLAVQQNVELLTQEMVIETPMGSLVTVLLRTETDEPLINSDYYAELIETEYPGAVVVGYATIRYNCHAYAWANSTLVWMNDPSPYWSDGSYIRVDAEDQNIIGNKIYYPGFGNEHSGIVIRNRGNTIESKWGDKNLVQHALENCPYYYIPLQIRVYEGQF